MAAGVLFGDFSELRVNNLGDVVFNAKLIGNGVTQANNYALLKKFQGLPIAPVFAEGEFLGLISPQVTYGDSVNFNFNPILNPILTDDRDIWYTTTIAGTEIDGTAIDSFSNGVLLRREFLGDFRLIARSGDYVEGSSNGLRRFTKIYLTAPDQAVFGSGTTISSSFTGVFSADGMNPLDVIALNGMETQDSGIFYSYLYTSGSSKSNFKFKPVNDSGDLSFLASIYDSLLDAEEDVIYFMASDGDPRLRVRKGGRSAEFGDSLSFISFQWPLLDNTGRVVFHSTLTDDTQGLFVNSAHDLTRTLVRAGDELEIDIDGSGLVSVEIESFSHPNEFNDTGALAIRVGFGRNELAIVRILVPQFGTCTCPGDLNEDGRVAGDDMQGFVACLVETAGDCDCANVNGFDGVTPTDIGEFVERLLASDNACP